VKDLGIIQDMAALRKSSPVASLQAAALQMFLMTARIRHGAANDGRFRWRGLYALRVTGTHLARRTEIAARSRRGTLDAALLPPNLLHDVHWMCRSLDPLRGSGQGAGFHRGGIPIFPTIIRQDAVGRNA